MRTAQQQQQQQQNHQNSKKTSSLFSCAFFRQCTDSPLSPTPPHTSPPHLPPAIPLPPPLPRAVAAAAVTRHLITPPPLGAFHHPSKPSSSSSSSSSSASQSFTQWRFPPTYHHPPPVPPAAAPSTDEPTPSSELMELYHMAELHFTSGSETDHMTALQVLERILVPNPPSDTVHGGGAVVPVAVVNGVVLRLKEQQHQLGGVKSATKVLLALCLSERNRHVAVECGAAARVVDALPDMDGSVAERALAALDLMCTVTEGAAQVGAHALAVPMLVEVMGRMEGRGREYAISVLAAVYGGGDHRLWEVAPAEEVARAVMLAMQQGDCSARGKRKGAQLLKVLQENGKLDLTQ